MKVTVFFTAVLLCIVGLTVYAVFGAMVVSEYQHVLKGFGFKSDNFYKRLLILFVGIIWPITGTILCLCELCAFTYRGTLSVLKWLKDDES